MAKSREKLIEVKQQWAREKRGLTGQQGRDRLPPGQHLVTDWPVLDIGTIPEFDANTWSLTVSGEVENPLRWSWQDFDGQPQVELVSDIHCVTAWSRYDNRWAGVSIAHLLDLVRPKPAARFAVLRSFDGYVTNIPIEYLAAKDSLLAHSWQNAPLSQEHGGPVRLIVPQLYFWKSAKWLRSIVFTAEDQPGFWERRGYHLLGDPWREQRYEEDDA